MAKNINQYTLTLGKDPIHIGYSADMGILLKAKGIAIDKEISFIMFENGHCFLNDLKAGTKQEMNLGEKMIIGNCEVLFCN